MAKISAFTIIKNTLSQGYPFVESIISAMPVCDEFVIADGYSTDGTWEILEKLAQLYPKIRLSRDEWVLTEKNSKSMGILAEMTNKAKQRCKNDYLLYIQANEVLHEADNERIRSMPLQQRQGLKLFYLPYLCIVGSDFVFSEEFRCRFVANLKEINAIRDAGHLSFDRKWIENYFIGALMNPLKTKDKIDALLSVYMPGMDGIRRPYAHIMLPKPVFRYFGIYSEDYVQKLEKHREISGNYAHIYKELINLAKSSSEKEFTTAWFKYMNPINKGSFLEMPYRLKLNEHPKIIQGLLKTKTKKYFVRKELLEKVWK